MKFSLKLLACTLLAALLTGAAYAHVVVTPGQADVGQELVFNVSVPNEQNTPVVDVKLLIPTGVTSVVPTEKTGWTINIRQNSNNTAITSLEWTDSSIPVGEREDFSFSAQMPASAGQLDWKAYQTYDDGTVVHWDQTPSGSDDSVGTAGPYSVTKVINDLQPAATSNSISPNTKANIGIGLGVVALLISLFGVARKKS